MRQPEKPGRALGHFRAVSSKPLRNLRVRPHLPTCQLDTPVLGATLFRFIRCHGRVDSAAKRVETLRGDALRAECVNHTGGTAPAEVKVIVRLALIVSVSDDVDAE